MALERRCEVQGGSLEEVRSLGVRRPFNIAMNIAIMWL
jgi:hypothetical protein